jgi:hypothetical protein
MIPPDATSSARRRPTDRRTRHPCCWTAHGHPCPAEAVAVGTRLTHGTPAHAWPGHSASDQPGATPSVATGTTGVTLQARPRSRSRTSHRRPPRHMGPQQHATEGSKRPLARHQGPGHSPAGRTAVRAQPGTPRPTDCAVFGCPITCSTAPGPPVGTPDTAG